MSLSTNTDYQRYAQYSSRTASVNGQQRVHQKKQTQSGDPNEQLLQLVDNSTGNQANKRKDPLDSLVESGTITSDQKQAIKEALEASRMEHQAQMDGKSTSGSFQDPLESLVENGTITEDQQEVIKSAFESMKKSHKMPPQPPSLMQIQQSEGTDSVSSLLDQLLSSDTTSEDQKSSLISVLQSVLQSNTTDLTDSQGTNEEAQSQQSSILSQFQSIIKAYESQFYSDTDLETNRFKVDI